MEVHLEKKGKYIAYTIIYFSKLASAAKPSLVPKKILGVNNMLNSEISMVWLIPNKY